MDLNSLLNTLLSNDSIEQISKKSGSSKDDVKNVLKEALPHLLDGANNQSKDSEKSKELKKRLDAHAKKDTSDLSSFLDGIDKGDAEKLVKGLFDSSTSETASVENISKKSGISLENVGGILQNAAPMLMSLLGQQNSSQSSDDSSNGIGNLIGSLLGGGNSNSVSGLGGILSGLLGGNDDDGKKDSDGFDLGNITNIIGNLLK